MRGIKDNFLDQDLPVRISAVSSADDLGGIDARRRAFNIETRGEGVGADEWVPPDTVGYSGDFDTLEFTITYMADLPQAVFLDELVTRSWR